MLSGDFLVPLDDLTDDKLHQFFDKHRVEIGSLCQFRKPIVLKFLPIHVHCRQMVFCFQFAYLIGAAKTFCKHMDERCVDIVDGIPKGGELKCDIWHLHKMSS